MNAPPNQDPQPVSEPAQREPGPIVLRWKSYPVRATYGLMGGTILVYILQILSETLLGTDMPALFGANHPALLADGQIWRLVTPLFLHGSLMHIGFNMYALLILGRDMESVLGWWRFLALYLAAGVAGNVFSALFTASWSLGASTALFGIIAFELVFVYLNRDFFGRRADALIRQALGLAALNFVIGLAPGIDNWGHLGGFLGGLLFAWLAGPRWQVRPSADGLEVFDPRASVQPTLLAVSLVVGISLALLIASWS